MITLAVFTALFLLAGVGMYNSLVVKRNSATNAFASIDAILKKRFDLIPNLVATVQAYAKHEQDTFSKIAALRSRNYSDLSDNEKIGMANEMNRAQSMFGIMVERYPDLKASESFLKLQASLNETEEQLSAARRAYNSAVTLFNNAVQTFPTNLLASWFGFTPLSVLEITEAERANPDVKKLFS